MLEYSALFLEQLVAIAFLNEGLEGNKFKPRRFIKHERNKRPRINMSLYLSKFCMMLISIMIYNYSSVFILCSSDIYFHIFSLCVPKTFLVLHLS